MKSALNPELTCETAENRFLTGRSEGFFGYLFYFFLSRKRVLDFEKKMCKTRCEITIYREESGFDAESGGQTDFVVLPEEKCVRLMILRQFGFSRCSVFRFSLDENKEHVLL